MWERYCRGVDAIVFLVDIADYNLLGPPFSRYSVPFLPDSISHELREVYYNSRSATQIFLSYMKCFQVVTRLVGF
jgi:hypothetical protein